MSPCSSSPSISTSPTLLLRTQASRKDLSDDELVALMSIVPNPHVPLYPAEHYNNSYFGFMTTFRRAVHAAIPGVSKYQNAITKEAARRWNLCDEYTKLHWTLLAGASNVFSTKVTRKKTGKAAHSRKAHQVSGPSRGRLARTNPYSRSSKSGHTSSASYSPYNALSPSMPGFQTALPSLVSSPPDSFTPLHPVLPAWYQVSASQAPAAYHSREYGMSLPCLPKTSLTPYALDSFQYDRAKAPVSGAYPLNDMRPDYDSSSEFIWPSQVTEPAPLSIDAWQPQTSLASSVTPHDFALCDGGIQANVIAPSSTSLFDDFLDTLRLEPSSL